MTSLPTVRTITGHPLRAETVRGFASWAGAAVVLTLGVLLAGSSPRWQGGWAETATELHNAQLIVVPLAAAAGCRQGGRERRRRTGELLTTAVRPPLARFLASALPVAVWVAVGQLLAVGLALLATWPYALGDRPHLALVPGDVVASASAVLAGHVVGRAVPSRLAAPLLAMAGYVGLGILAVSREGAGRHLNPAFPAGDDSVPLWWQSVAMAVWTAGLAAAAVLAYAARRRAGALLPLAAATTAGALLVLTGDGLWHTDPLARRQVCDTSVTPAVCVNARYAGLLPQVSKALSGVTGKLEGVRNVPVRWEDHLGAPRGGEAELPNLTPIGWSLVRGRLTDPVDFAWQSVAALSGHDECDEVPPRVYRTDEAVEHYLAPSPGEAYFDELSARGTPAQRAELQKRRAARARLAAMGDEERRDWLSAYFAAAGTCAGLNEVPTL
ncbi:hypothetical protein [Streptomyces brasiliensis]|uniref:Uncharacterized protein n=1 Tax=Streptomyces brasiliensis TaxID=1954 RepID=A0A917L192_9ACTN|nr:hypothetical protein [Streptomyces brasiliensis]GGJ37113.1 hypothetical protein GCM10010121_055370 [Streptomyces brasiliensis]